jgi:mycothiol synthase
VNLPDGYSWRPARPGDVDAIVAVLHAGDLLDVGEPDTTPDKIEEVFTSPFVDPDHDLWVVEAAGAGVVGYGEVHTENPRFSLDAFVRVHPDHRGRGISSALLDRTEARGLARVDSGDRIRWWATASTGDAHGLALLRGRGAEHVRSFWHMERSLEEPEPDGESPPGVILRGFDGSEWATFHRVLEDAFAGHFGFEPLTLDTFVRLWTVSPTWDPGLVTFAEEDGRVVGLVVSSVTATPELGWVRDVGVLPPHRGRGIARTLLRRSFADLASRGCRRVRLNVDAANETGANRLYEKVGMHVRREWAVFERLLVRD